MSVDDGPEASPEPTARETVRTYYDALRAGDPLAPFFADDERIVKFGISERLVGGDQVASGLREQTETTTDWTVDSRDLRATERAAHAWFSDDVFLAWTDADRSIRYEFETRWSGTLERRGDDREPTTGGSETIDSKSTTIGEWRFVGMHVSTAREL